MYGLEPATVRRRNAPLTIVSDSSWQTPFRPAAVARPRARNGFTSHLQWKARTHPMPRQFDVVIERDAEGYYVASVPQIPACHTQARSLDEVTERIREAIELCLEVEGPPEHDLEFVGIQRVTIAA